MRLSEIEGGEAPAAPQKLSQVIGATPAPAPEQKGFLGKAWDTLVSAGSAVGGAQADIGKRFVKGMAGEDASSTGGFGMGVADPVVGLAQLSANVPGSPLSIASRFSKMLGGPDANDLVNRREASFEASREREAGDYGGGGEKPDLGTAWSRLVGNVASPLNFVGGAGVAGKAAGAGASLGRRLLSALPGAVRAGAMGGAMQPATGDNFVTAKLPQVAAGAVTGGMLAPAMAAGGALRQAMTPSADSAIAKGFAKGFGIPTRGIQNQGDLEQIQQYIPEVTRDIVANLPKHSITTPAGRTVSGMLPQTRGQTLEVFEQGKDRLFREFNSMVERADQSAISGPTPIVKFQRGLDEARFAEAQARNELARAQQDLANTSLGGDSRVGSAIDPTAPGFKTIQQRAQRAVSRAESDLENAIEGREAAEAKASKPWVDLKPVAAELERFAQSEGVTTTHKDIARYAMERAKELRETEAMTAQGAQAAIKNYNASLKAFYANPTFETAQRASVDAMIANKLRAQTDEMVNSITGQDYQALKSRYGAYSALEKQVARGALRELNRPEDRQFLNSFVNVSSGEELLRGILTLNPSALARGALGKLALAGERWRNSPDRAVAGMFRAAQREAVGARAPGMSLSLGAGLGSAAADATNRYRPIGDGRIRRYTAPERDDSAYVGVP